MKLGKQSGTKQHNKHRYDTIQRLHSKTDRTCQFSLVQLKVYENENVEKKTMIMRLIHQEANQ